MSSHDDRSIPAADPSGARRPVRIGFLGAGLIAHYHALQLHGCETPHQVVAVHDPDQDRMEAFAGWGAKPTSSVAEVIGASDAVFVCAWTAAHLPLVREVVAAGRAVFCEKPLSTDLAGAVEMAELVERAGVVHMTGLVLRSLPPLLALREMIRDPRSGRVMNVVFRDDQYIPTQGLYASTWRGDAALAGSGTLLEHSIHDLDILEWLVGDVVTLTARTAHFHGIEGIEDSVGVLFGFEAGHTATLTSVWHDMLSRPSQRRMEVFCERAVYVLGGDTVGPVSWQVDEPDGDGGVATDEGTIEGGSIENWLEARGVEVLEAEELFLRAIGGGPAPVPSIRDAVRAHVLADAVYRSAGAGGLVVDVSAPRTRAHPESRRSST